MKLNEISDNPGARNRASASAAASARARARPPAAAARARRRAPACASTASKAARCRSIAACPSAASTTSSAQDFTSSISAGCSRRSTPASSTPARRRRRGAGRGRRAAAGRATACACWPRASSRRPSSTHRGRRRLEGGDRGGREGRRQGRSSAGRASRRPKAAGSVTAARRQSKDAHRWRQPPNNSPPTSIFGLRQGDRAQEPHLVHARRAGDLPARHLHPAARHRSRVLHEHLPAASRRHPRHVRHVLGRRARAHDDLRARHHAVHLGLDHHPADDRGVAAARSAEEGRRDRPQEAQPVHPLRHGRARRRSRPTASPSALEGMRAGGPSVHRSRACSSA